MEHSSRMKSTCEIHIPPAHRVGITEPTDPSGGPGLTPLPRPLPFKATDVHPALPRAFLNVEELLCPPTQPFSSEQITFRSLEYEKSVLAT